jgi:hypothetical protein
MTGGFGPSPQQRSEWIISSPFQELVRNPSDAMGMSAFSAG